MINEIEKRELRNREARLRRAAAKKDMFIKKQNIHINNGGYHIKIISYNIGVCNEELNNIIIYGCDQNGCGAVSIEEAEEFVRKC